MKKTFVLLPFLFFFWGCANRYSQFYTDLTDGKNVLENPNVIIPTGKPKLVQGYNIEKDNKRMKEDGYMLLGFSYFNAGEIDQNAALEHAKKIHADNVIVYRRYTDTRSGMMPMTVPSTQTSFHSGTIHSFGSGFGSYSGTSTTFGSETTYIPYSFKRYDYYASYWIKMKPLRLGIYYDDLTDELRKSVGSNKGIYITVVVKHSPAFNSDLLCGDVISRANGVEIIDKSHFQNWLNETQASTIEFEIFRNGKNIIKKVHMQH